ncbi:MAG: hypothetical protein JNN25_04855, partial [Candidatus Kapabacteria bacterium]|nr:hypothetical protein [Candidatus Kapabacteria bacterium]
MRYFASLCAFMLLLFASSCMPNYNSMEIAVNTAILSDKNQSSFIVRFAFGSAPDSVMVFPIVDGRIIGIKDLEIQSGRSYAATVGYRGQSIRIFRQQLDNNSQNDFLTALGTSTSLVKLSISIDNVSLYDVDYSREPSKKDDITTFNVGIPKQLSETLGILPIGFDSTQYTIELANRTRDTCTIAYSTHLAAPLNSTLLPHRTMTLHTLI